MSTSQQPPDRPFEANAQPPTQPHGTSGQPYGTPAQPYSAPGQPYGTPAQPNGTPAPSYGTPPSSNGENSLGRTAFIAAAASAGLSLLFRLFAPLFYLSGDFAASEAIEGILSVLVIGGSAAGVVIAVIALRRPAPHLLAALALGIAGSTLLGTVVAWASSFFYLYL